MKYLTEAADKNAAHDGSRNERAIACPYADECTCVTNDRLAANIRTFMVNGEERKLAGKPLPACHQELRACIAPGQTGEQILQPFPRPVYHRAARNPVAV